MRLVLRRYFQNKGTLCIFMCLCAFVWNGQKQREGKRKATTTTTTSSSTTHRPTTMRPVHNGLFTRYAPRLRFGHHRLFSTYIQECGSFLLCARCMLFFFIFCLVFFLWFVMFGSANMHVNKRSYRIATKQPNKKSQREWNALPPRIRATLAISHRKLTSIFLYTSAHTHTHKLDRQSSALLCAPEVS